MRILPRPDAVFQECDHSKCIEMACVAVHFDERHGFLGCPTAIFRVLATEPLYLEGSKRPLVLEADPPGESSLTKDCIMVLLVSDAGVYRVCPVLKRRGHLLLVEVNPEGDHEWAFIRSRRAGPLLSFGGIPRNWGKATKDKRWRREERRVTRGERIFG